ncbi:MotA/TolQ/ExbB proton channel family protein [Blautia difficilis]|uniref:MotA/TolQ/ExbB proton channel family protein n=1 Tax=Blautia difficilis TaxID=2763027 RepID=A0ABR7IFE9_9FIRM|nr:MotA/TolQ/ExbB proton channel family protein [Blautia difficilis]MBC5778729.1 MotA/TolQ/ExbB proton channel family protein [Blautia difficilis]
MSKKVLNLLAFLAVLAGCIAMTVFTGKGSVSTMIYNFAFLAIMTVLYLAGMLGGMFRVEGIGQALHRGKEELTGIFKTPGKVKNESLVYLKGIFDHKYLDGRLDDFVDGMNQAKEGIGEIEDYINEDDIDLHVHKRILEMIPDIFTSLGILGTFIGLVWGLKNFEPSSYETMTNSVSSLVAGIKVAFLTSIYGIAFAIIYTSGMKSVFSDMNEKLQAFLEKFHIYVLPTAENESRNLMVASQKLQVKAMKQMAEQLSAEMAQSFEKAINPTFQKMNESLDVLTESVTSCQQDVMQEILRSFLREMNGSFKMQFKDFNDALAQLKKAQKENTEYTTNLYHTMSDQLNSSYERQSETMKDMVNELGNAQGRYMSTASRIAQDNQEIQKMQQQDYQRVADYLKEAEKTSAKFWVACNQTMQRYVETASQGMEKVSVASQTGTDVLKANRQVMEELEKRLADFASCQDKTLQTMEEVRRLLTDISVTKENGNISLTGGQQNLNAFRMADRQSMDRLYALMKEQGEKQEALLEEMNRNLRELSKTPQKGKFGLFR